MKVSSHRLDRYAAIAACGSGAVGLAVSPLHGDVQYFGTEITLSLPGGSFTSGTVNTFIVGGGVSWSLMGSRSAYQNTYSLYNNGGTFFTYTFSSFGSFTNAWFVDAPQHNSDRLFSVGHVIDAATLGSGTGLNVLHTATGSWTEWVVSYSSTLGGSYFNAGGESHSSSSGILAAGQRGFLALGFELDGEAVFGWADISLSADGLSLTLHGWAFEDSGEAILAGQTEGGGTPVPGLGGLAALACGAAGLRRKRDRVA
ncbi:MAG: hypothetical protein VX672_04045 [Planctomycetota bacterium]|nr:hypothetical protein [Planctomycetota bacterium]